MSYQFIEVKREARLTIITINRPGVHNALNEQAQIEMAGVFDDFFGDDDQWIAIVTGAGEKAFCAGHDLKQQAAGGGMATPGTGFAGLTARFDCTKPVIAAVNGVAMGGGFELALACDIIVASSNAVFAAPEPRVGLAAIAGGWHRLPRAIGLHRAMGILLTSRNVSAHEGASLGFVNEVTDGDVMSLALSWAGTMLECSPLSLRATKQGVMDALGKGLDLAIKDQWQLSAMQKMLASEDACEGPLAFMERRNPQWTGR